MRDKEALLDRVAGFLNAWDPKLEDFIAANRKALDKVNYTTPSIAPRVTRSLIFDEGERHARTN